MKCSFTKCSNGCIGHYNIVRFGSWIGPIAKTSADLAYAKANRIKLVAVGEY